MRTEAVDGVRLAIPHLPNGSSELERATALSQLTATLLDGLPLPIFWYYTPAAVAFSEHLERRLAIYDNMDELSGFRGASSDLFRLEQVLLETADLVFTGGYSLYEAKRQRHAAVHCFPSSVDVAHFRQARDGKLPDPADQASLPHPRLGYIGVIDERMDMTFVAELSEARPEWQLVFVGPVVKIDVADLPRRSNIHWLGMKTYRELPHYLAHWDLALMPFVLDRSTRFISPTKTPEFLAAGLPVLSTPVRDVVRAYGGRDGLVSIVDTPQAAIAAAENILRGLTAHWLARVDAALAENSWDSTWHSMHALIEAELQVDHKECVVL